MRFGSVCSGIEAASVAWAPLGWKAAWFSEIEPFPCAVLKHHYPTVPNLGDMTALPHRILSGEIEAPDMLCGGTPCQAFSVAGLRNSLDDHRGNLTLTFVEIANAIDERRLVRGLDPAIIFWENVPGVLNTKDNAFGCFLAGLAGEDDALVPPGGRWTNAGFVDGPQRAVAWRVLDAQYFGVAQRRRRVFVVASARDDFDPAAVLFEFDGVRRDFAPSRETGQEIAGTFKARANSGGWGQDVDLAAGGYMRPWPTEVAPTLDAHYGDKMGLENQHINAGGCSSTAMCLTTKVRIDAESETLIPTLGGHFSYGIPGNWIGRKPENGGNATEPMVDIAPCLTKTDRHGVATTQYGEIAGSLTARHDSSPRADRGMNVIAFHHNAQACQLPSENRDTSVSDSLTCSQQAAIAYPIDTLLNAMQVRRLTPTECERLMGFPDGYTAIPWRNKPASECPDGPRYKALGNSWAVPCARWIGERISRAI